MFTTTKTVDLTMLYVREGKNPDSDTSRGTGGKGGIAQMTLFISSSGQEKSPYTVSRSTSLGQALRVYDCQRVLLVGHACTYISLLSNYLSFSPSSPPPSSMRQQYGLVQTQTNREGKTRIGTHTCSRNGVKIRVATLLARHCCVAANSRRTRPPLGNRQPQG